MELPQIQRQPEAWQVRKVSNTVHRGTDQSTKSFLSETKTDVGSNWRGASVGRRVLFGHWLVGGCGGGGSLLISLPLTLCASFFFARLAPLCRLSLFLTSLIIQNETNRVDNIATVQRITRRPRRWQRTILRGSPGQTAIGPSRIQRNRPAAFAVHFSPFSDDKRCSRIRCCLSRSPSGRSFFSLF
jgi:hypothetical protein